MNIGEVIYYERKKMSLTQEKVCKGICSIAYLSKLENNKIKARQEILVLICKRLKLHVSDLSDDKEGKILESIRLLYHKIDNSEICDVKNELSKLRPIIENQNNPFFKLSYQIVFFNYSLVTKDKKLSEKIKLTFSTSNRRLFNIELRYWLLKALGHYEYLYGDLLKSKNYLCRALEIGNIEDATLYYHLGLVHAKIMEMATSIQYTLKALDIYNNKMNFKKVLDCHLLLGINYNRCNNLKLAEKYFKDIINSSCNDKSSSLLSKAFHNLGYVYILRNKFKQSINYLLTSLKYKKTKYEKLSTIYLLAYVYKRTNNCDLMNDMVKIGKESFAISLSFYYKFLLLENIDINLTLLKPQLVTILEKEIVPYFLNKDRIICVECMKILARHYEQINKYKQANLYYKKINELMLSGKRRELLY